MTEALGAERHERTEEQAGYRNGTRARTLYTRVGPVTLLVPQTRDGSFPTDMFRRATSGASRRSCGADGDGRARRLDAQGIPDHRGIVRGELLETDGERAVRWAGCAWACLQRAATRRRVSVHSRRCDVSQEPRGLGSRHELPDSPIRTVCGGKRVNFIPRSRFGSPSGRRAGFLYTKSASGRRTRPRSRQSDRSTRD